MLQRPKFHTMLIINVTVKWQYLIHFLVRGLKWLYLVYHQSVSITFFNLIFLLSKCFFKIRLLVILPLFSPELLKSEV